MNFVVNFHNSIFLCITLYDYTLQQKHIPAAQDLPVKIWGGIGASATGLYKDMEHGVKLAIICWLKQYLIWQFDPMLMTGFHYDFLEE